MRPSRVNDRAAAMFLLREIWPVAARKLDRVNAAADLSFLADPPANRFERGDAFEVCVEVYHR